jgi:hypothetical protein
MAPSCGTSPVPVWNQPGINYLKYRELFGLLQRGTLDTISAE